MSVRRAQAEIDSAEFAEWIAWHSMEPFTHERSENLLCIIASIMCNITRGKGVSPFKPEDFKPKYGDKKERETAKSMEIKLRALFKHGNN